MEMPANRFKRSLGHGVMLGTWLMSGSTAAAEGLGCVGFDFLVVDTEHVPIDAPQVLSLLQAIAGTPAQPIVRLAWNDAVLVKRAMDMGRKASCFRSSRRRTRRVARWRRPGTRRQDRADLPACIARAGTAPSPISDDTRMTRRA